MTIDLPIQPRAYILINAVSSPPQLAAHLLMYPLRGMTNGTMRERDDFIILALHSLLHCICRPSMYLFFFSFLGSETPLS